MKKILKIQALILLLLTIIIWINKGNPDSALMIILTLILAPIMLFSSHWGIEIYIYTFILFTVVLSLMIYGYKQRDIKQGIIAFSVGFWLYAFTCFLFVGMNF
jgi:hypothetical protein